MLTQQDLDERWEYRRAHRGDSAEWAKAPKPGAKARPGESLWKTQQPPIVGLITEVASIIRLAQGDERVVSLLTADGDVWHLQRHNRSGEVGIRGAVVVLWRGPADDRVQANDSTQATGDNDDQATQSTTDAEEAALCGWLMDVAADPLHPVPPGAWRALSSASPVAALAREVLPLDEPIGFYDGASEVLGALREQGLWLWTVNWQANVTEHDWAVFQWIYGSAAMWSNLRGVLPPRTALTHLLTKRPAPEGADATLRTLRMLYERTALTLEGLAKQADALDGAGVSHGLRAGEMNTQDALGTEGVAEAGGEDTAAGDTAAEDTTAEDTTAEDTTAEDTTAEDTTAANANEAAAAPEDVVIELGESGLTWRIADAKQLSDRALITLSMGPHVAVVPASLQAHAEAMLLARQGPQSGRTALFWRLHQMPVDAAELLADPTCVADWRAVLTWAEESRAGRRGAPPWVEALMMLAEAHVAATRPLGPTDAERLWRLVAEADNSDAVLCRLFGLARNARALLKDVGYTFERLPTVTTIVRHRHGTQLRTLDPDQAANDDASTSKRTEARHG